MTIPGDLAAFITATDEAGAKKQAETLAAKLTTPGHDQGVRPAGNPTPGPVSHAFAPHTPSGRPPAEFAYLATNPGPQ